MAKPRTPNQKKKYTELNKRLKQYMSGVMSIYDKHNLEASLLVGLTDYTGEGEEPFSFSDYPLLKGAVEKAEQSFVDDMEALIMSGTSKEWQESNHVQDLLANDVLRAYRATPNTKKPSYYQKNNDQYKAFIERKENGMHLSNKLWKQGKQYRQALEDTISVAIEKGMSAPMLAKEVSKYLKDFERVKKNYKNKYGKEPKSVNVQYASMRLAVSEINMAYRTAEQARWNQMDFIVGYEIKTQGAHGHEHVSDICDTLQGKYPKSFKWVGWHPLCRCIAIPILNTEDDFWSLEPTESKNTVTDIPEATKQWIIDNEARIKAASKRHKLPYWIRDNYEIKNGKINLISTYPKQTTTTTPQPPIATIEQIAKKRHEDRSPEKEQMLRDWWMLHKRRDAITRAADIRHKKRDDNAILSAWKSRQATYKYANKILNYIDNIPDVDTTILKEALKKGKYDIMLSEANKLKAIGKEIKSFNYIDNPIESAKTYGYNSIKVVNESIKKKIDSISTMSLEEQKKQLQKEILYVQDPTYLKPHKIYNTWEVAQKAYNTELAKVIDRIEWDSVNIELTQLEKFKTKSQIYKSLISQIYNDISNKDLSSAKLHLTELNNKKLKIESASVKKSTEDKKLYLNGLPFTADELRKISDYENQIISSVINGNPNNILIEHYHDYISDLCHKYFDKQISIFGNSELKSMKKIKDSYLSRIPTNPHYVWGGELGGVYGNNYKPLQYISKIKISGLTTDDLSIPKRFTQGSTFSNAYNLKNTSAFWKQTWEQHMMNAGLNASEIAEQEAIIEEYSQSCNYVLNKMVRYRGVTFRGLNSGGGGEVRAQLLDAYKNGTTWINNASCSTSMKYSVADAFDGDTIMIIHNKTGAYIHEISDYDSEFEIMTLRGAKYKVLSPPKLVKFNNGTERYVVELEEIV